MSNPDYYNRFDPALDWDSIRFRAEKGLQSAELNEIESLFADRIKGIGNIFFTDGAVVRDATIRVNPLTGETQCDAGAIYLRGAVRGVAPSVITVPVSGRVNVGVYAVDTVVTELEDPSLRDPAVGTRNYNEPGAARGRVTLVWGYEGDGQAGQFYRCYMVEDGVLRSNAAPPNIDAITQALSRYDRDSAGGNYIISGMAVEALADDAAGNQVYVLHNGRCRVNGYPVELSTSRRILYKAVPDLRQIVSEPKTSTSVSAFRFDTDYVPIAEIDSVQVTSETTVTMTHGPFVGAQDLIPQSAVLSIVEVKQGGTTYTAGTDYLLTGGKVDWSPGGLEPATGSTYTCKFRFIQSVTPTAVDGTGFTVAGALVGTLVLATYSYKVPRVDRLAIDSDGNVRWINGVASDVNPKLPAVPPGTLWLAAVSQTWDENRRITMDAPKMTPMSDLSRIQSKLDLIAELILEDRLRLDVSARESGMKIGIFVDPFSSDALRDAGVVQTAAVVGGELVLPVTAVVHQMTTDISAPQTLLFELDVTLAQEQRTMSMQVNPYLSFAPIAAQILLSPAVDRWTDVETTWASPITRRLHKDSYRNHTSESSVEKLLSKETTSIETLRQIDVQFTASGFDPGEHLLILEFDGISVMDGATAV